MDYQALFAFTGQYQYVLTEFAGYVSQLHQLSLKVTKIEVSSTWYLLILPPLPVTCRTSLTLHGVLLSLLLSACVHTTL